MAREKGGPASTAESSGCSARSGAARPVGRPAGPAALDHPAHGARARDQAALALRRPAADPARPATSAWPLTAPLRKLSAGPEAGPADESLAIVRDNGLDLPPQVDVIAVQVTYQPRLSTDGAGQSDRLGLRQKQCVVARDSSVHRSSRNPHRHDTRLYSAVLVSGLLSRVGDPAAGHRRVQRQLDVLCTVLRHITLKLERTRRGTSCEHGSPVRQKVRSLAPSAAGRGAPERAGR